MRHSPPMPAGAEAFQAATSAVSLYGGASAGYRTMLDALLPAAKAFTDVRGHTARGAAHTEISIAGSHAIRVPCRGKVQVMHIPSLL